MASNGASRLPRYLELVARDGRTVVDVIPLENEDPFTLETFESLIQLHAEKGRDFVLARVQTQDPENEDNVFYSHYAAHHLNKILFYRRGRNLVRVEALNPLTNTPICGDVEYYIVDLTSPQSHVSACRSVPMRRKAETAKLHSKAFHGSRNALQICATPSAAVRAMSPTGRMQRGSSADNLVSNAPMESQSQPPAPTAPPPPPPPPPAPPQPRQHRNRRMSAAAREGHRFRRQLSMPVVSRQFNTSTTCLVLHDRVRMIKCAEYAAVAQDESSASAAPDVEPSSAATPRATTPCHAHEAKVASYGATGTFDKQPQPGAPLRGTGTAKVNFVGTMPALLSGTDVDFLKKPAFRARLAECALDPSDAVLFEIPGAPQAHVNVGMPPLHAGGGPASGFPGGFQPHPILPEYTYQYVPGPPGAACVGQGSCIMWHVWRFLVVYVLLAFLITRYVVPAEYATISIIVFTTAPFALYSLTQCCYCWSTCFSSEGLGLRWPRMCRNRSWRRCFRRDDHERLPSGGNSSSLGPDIV